MDSIYRYRRSTAYILREMIPAFVGGVLVFILIMLTFQALRLVEFILIHGVGVKVIMELALYMSVSFLPAILPMSLLFAVLMTYNRMSADSEIIAMKTTGMGMLSISLPAFLLSLVVAAISAYTLFKAGPWGNREFEVLITKMSQQKAASQIREGTFSEGFFDLVIYANKVDSDRGILKDVFIYDERNEDLPLTIVAKEGKIIQDLFSLDGTANLNLYDGNMHRTTKEGKYMRLKFKSYKLSLSNEAAQETRKKSPPSMSYEELTASSIDEEIKPKNRLKYIAEIYKRFSVPTACLLFGLLGVGLGVVNNRRSGRSFGLVICLASLVSYWGLYITMEGVARSGSLHPGVAIWIPNFILAGIVIASLKKIWN